jgi:hypothetical protein
MLLLIGSSTFVLPREPHNCTSGPEDTSFYRNIIKYPTYVWSSFINVLCQLDSLVYIQSRKTMIMNDDSDNY